MTDRIDLPSQDVHNEIFDDAFEKGASSGAESRDAEWLAAVDELIRRANTMMFSSDAGPMGTTVYSSRINALEELKSKMAR